MPVVISERKISTEQITNSISTASEKKEYTDKELLEAWETEARKCFNKCHKCGKWVIDAMYNVDILECVDCAPWQEQPLYCSNCGASVEACERVCSKCGKPLFE